MSVRWVDTDELLDEVIDDVLGEARYAIDTEFHREKTYFPKLALVQIRWKEQTALIDPLAVDPRKLARLFESDVLAVFHAPQQDLEVLRYAALSSPKYIFDCQLAAGFVGFSNPSLATLVQAMKRISLSKGDRLTDWLRRPLTEQQCNYAAEDVAHLFDLHDELTRQLSELGRVQWVVNCCAELVNKPASPQNAVDAWLKLKEARALKGGARGIAQALAKWREEKAMRNDLPPRRIMSDMALVAIAQRIPKNVEELATTRGIDDRHLSAENCREIMSAVREGSRNTVSIPSSENDELDKVARPALTLITAWIGELARRHKLDTSLLATRNDIVAYLRNSPDSRLHAGWRAELVGDDLNRILTGAVGLSVDRDGHLKLVDAKG